jgi:hypothetical protein
MITADATYFPYNAVDKIVTTLRLIDPEIIVVKRPLRDSDPVQCIGVFASQWMPDEESYEMRGLPTGIHEPTLSSYIISIQVFVKDADEERGAATHATLSKIVRAMLYRDAGLRVALRALTAVVAGSTESTRRFGVRTQRYLSNELSGSWFYLSNIEFWLETETS